jgi:hypothetical protein
MNKDHRHRVSILALSCCEASRLISEQQDRVLTRRERWALRIHTWVCDACRRFRAHLDFLRDAAARLPAEFRSELLTGTVQLAPARRDEIKRLLAKATASEK